MMQTDSASTDEDIGGREEKDEQDENEAGRAEAVCFSPFGTLETTPTRCATPFFRKELQRS
jgi:hypothetical protein